MLIPSDLKKRARNANDAIAILILSAWLWQDYTRTFLCHQYLKSILSVEWNMRCSPRWKADNCSALSAEYAIAQKRSHDEPNLIEKRQRLLQRFLVRVASHPRLSREHVFHRFLDGNTSWVSANINAWTSWLLKILCLETDGSASGSPTGNAS